MVHVPAGGLELRSRQTTLDAIATYGTDLITVFDLYVSGPTNIEVVLLFVKGCFLAPLTIRHFYVLTTAWPREVRI